MPGSVPSTRHPVSYLALTDDLCSLSNAHPPYPVFILTFFSWKMSNRHKSGKAQWPPIPITQLYKNQHLVRLGSWVSPTQTIDSEATVSIITSKEAEAPK